MWGILPHYGRYVIWESGSSPRMWGIRSYRVCGRGWHRGSSPRMWGILSDLSPSECYAAGPPHACGVYFVDSFIKSSLSVHPHACGVYEIKSKGSIGLKRFIPTHVGYTHDKSIEVPNFRGSSPRMWGIRTKLNMTLQMLLRFIPTHVGYTDESTGEIVSRETVHPHACGVYKESLKFLLNRIGSSPRMWGILPGTLVNHVA